MNFRRSVDWLQKQLLTIGSSAAGVIAGASPYQTPAQLYDVMVAAADGVLTEKDFTDDMRRGLVTEALHRDLLAEAIGARVHDHDQEKFLYHDKYPWAHALPDGWIVRVSDDETHFADIPVQLKCPRLKGWHEVRLKGVHTYWLLGSQHTLAMTDAPYEIFSVLNVETMRPLWFRVERDEGLISSLMALEKGFFEMFLSRERPFELMPMEIELPPLTGDYLELNTAEAQTAALAYLEADDLFRHAKELRDEAEKKIKLLMGEAKAADLPGLRAYRSRQTGRVTHDYEAMEKDGIALEKYRKQGEAFETFRAFRRPI